MGMITKMMLMVGLFLFAHPFGMLALSLSSMFKSSNTGYQILVYLVAIIATCGQCYLMDRIFIDAYMNTMENKWYMKRLDEKTECLRKERNNQTGKLNEAIKKVAEHEKQRLGDQDQIMKLREERDKCIEEIDALKNQVAIKRKVEKYINGGNVLSMYEQHINHQIQNLKDKIEKRKGRSGGWMPSIADAFRVLRTGKGSNEAEVDNKVETDQML